MGTPVAVRDDLLGDVRLQDPASIYGSSFPVDFLVLVVFVVFVVVIHLGIRWRQFLEHQVLRLDRLIQEAENSPMKRRIQLVGCFASVLLGGRFLESHPCPLSPSCYRHRPDGPDGVPTSFVGSAYRLNEARTGRASRSPPNRVVPPEQDTRHRHTIPGSCVQGS